MWLTGIEKVVPELRQSAASETNIADKVTEAIRKEHGTLSAQAMCRNILSKESFAKLRMPSLRTVEEQQSAKAYASAAQKLDRLTARVKAAMQLHALEILALIFGHADLASRCAISTGDDEATPLCVSPDAMGSVIALITKHCTPTQLEQEPDSSSAIHVLTISLIRLVEKNLQASTNLRLVQPADQTSSLLEYLNECLTIDLHQHPHCADVVDTCARLYAVGLSTLLPTADLQLKAATSLAAAMISGSSSAKARVSQTESLEESACELRPVIFEEASEHVIISTPGLVEMSPTAPSEPGKHWLATTGARIPMRSGRHLLNVRLNLPGSDVSNKNPQGWGAVSVGVVHSTLDVLTLAEEDPGSIPQWLVCPLTGETTRNAAGASDDQPNRATWIDTDNWWQCAQSAMAEDVLSVLLDLDEGQLIFFINGESVGAAFADLSGEFSWAVSLGPGVSIRATSASNLPIGMNCTTLEYKPPKNDRSIRETLLAALLAELSRPSALLNAASAPEQVQAFILPISEIALRKIQDVGTSLPITPAKSAAAAGWCWEGSETGHASFRNSSDGHTTTRTSGTEPDYAAVMGSACFETGKHTWTLSISGDTSGIWLGAASENMPRGSDSPPENMPCDSNCHIYYLASRGHIGENAGGTKRNEQRASWRIREKTPLRMCLDCDTGTLEFWSASSRSTTVDESDMRLIGRLTGVSGPVRPFLYFLRRMTLLATNHFLIEIAFECTAVPADQSFDEQSFINVPS